MDNQLSEEEMKQIAKNALKEFLKEQLNDFQTGLGKLVIRWVTIIIIVSIFHLFLHGKYQKIADYVVQITGN